MIRNVFKLLVQRWDFFAKLLVEHLEISFLAIAIAIVFGSIVGILISEYQKSAKWTLGVINFVYTIPSISMLGFLIPFSGVGNATGAFRPYGTDQCRPGYCGGGKGHGQHAFADSV